MKPMDPAAEHSSLVVRKDQYVTIQVSPGERMIMLQWTGYAPSPAFRAILDDAQQRVRSLGLTRWLADLRSMDAILKQDEQWTLSDWYPRMATSGLKRMAILTGSDYFNRMSVDRIITAASPAVPFITTFFDDVEKAKAWLLELDQ
ncbi:MAG: hypothetical protein JNL43_09535 [Flavobacteriales bacterium]|nr:hypothetical protein [Flavobacteriales bacterium]